MILLPKLSTLVWQYDLIPNELLPLALSLVGPQLKVLRLVEWFVPANKDPQNSLKSSLSWILHQFPHLEEFLLDYTVAGRHSVAPSHSIVPSSSVLHVLEQYSSLKYFKCTGIPIDEGAFHAFGKLSNLVILNVQLPLSLTWPSSGAGTLQFCALRSLILLTNARDYIAFSAVTSLSNVSDIKLRISEPPDQDDIPLFFIAIRQQFSPLKVSCLAICPSSPRARHEVADDGGATLRPTDLHPLLEYTTLRQLEVNLPCRYTLTSSFYLEIARALPEIRKINIGTSDVCVHDTPLPDISALVPFALHCPELRSLGICFNAALSLTAHGVDALLPKDAAASKVSHIDAGTSPIASPGRVAGSLARLFPNLSIVMPSFGERASRWRADWDTALWLLPWYKMIREDERRRMENKNGEQGGD
ncbi:hypothetical protein C8Q76DRAFT_784930 [Earliella scabrosa]|nr:hypothetical protein C8Q76DRAFT_784930 [Earliella scabrosa]